MSDDDNVVGFPGAEEEIYEEFKAEFKGKKEGDKDFTFDKVIGYNVQNGTVTVVVEDGDIFFLQQKDFLYVRFIPQLIEQED